MEFLAKETLAKVRAHELRLTEHFIDGARRIHGIHVYGPKNANKQVAASPKKMKSTDTT